jgi:hypothetical protein
LADRDLAHVSQRLGLATSTTELMAAEIVRRLGGITSWSLPVPPELVVSALRATADIARLVLGESSRRQYGRGRRRHRHGS